MFKIASLFAYSLFNPHPPAQKLWRHENKNLAYNLIDSRCCMDDSFFQFSSQNSAGAFLALTRSLYAVVVLEGGEKKKKKVREKKKKQNEQTGS